MNQEGAYYHMKKKLTIILFVLFILSPTTAFAEVECTTAAPILSAVSANNTDSVIPLSDVIVWKVKVVNGKTYRRRYNATKKQWIGDWELVP